MSAPTYEQLMPAGPNLTRNRHVPNMVDINVATAHGAYQGLRKALAEHTPEDVTKIVLESSRRKPAIISRQREKALRKRIEEQNG